MKFADTIHTVEKTDARNGATLIKGWEAELGKIDTPGAKGILHNLESLRKQLEKDEPDAERVTKLIAELGEATTKIAAHGDRSEDKLKALGAALSSAGK